MRGVSLLFSLFVALNVVVADSPAGELLPLLEPKARKSSLSDRDLGIFIPKHKASPGVTPGFTPRGSGLSVRQSCGNSAYGLCPSRDYCCPVGGLCCSSTETCCDRGFRCCKGGDCCPNTHNCVVVDGQEGCCPIGKVCSANGSQCADPGYIKCAGENFCCKPGARCYRDSDDQPKCGEGGDVTTRVQTTIRTTRVVTEVETSFDVETTSVRASNPFTTTVIDVVDSPTTTIIVGGGVPTTMSPFLPRSSSSTTSARAAATTSGVLGNSGLVGNTGTSGATSLSSSVGMTLTALVVGIVGTFVLA